MNREPQTLCKQIKEKLPIQGNMICQALPGMTNTARCKALYRDEKEQYVRVQADSGGIIGFRHWVCDMIDAFVIL